MVNDPIADILIQIKNGYLAGKKTIVVPFSKIKHELVKLIVKRGFLKSVTVKEPNSFKQLMIELKYQDNKPVFTNVVRMSKPGLRVYVKYPEIPLIYGGLGIAIISTPQGLLEGRNARKKKTGGEFICKIW